MFKHISAMGGLICLALQLNGQKLVDNNFIAPLELPPVISGTFGELRPNHFHSGVDYTTNGKYGYKVLSVADGYISRIKISPVGYGKALYVTHANGYTTVYGHLERFEGRIDSFAMAKQYATERFAIDYYPDPNELPVTSGQTIARSGNSGSSGGPHLHFEVRDTKTEKALNPFLFKRDATDNVKPTITGLRLYPIGNSASVSGKNVPQTFKVVKVGADYKIEGDPTVFAGGTIGAGIEAIDYLTGSVRQCGVFAVTLSVDDKVVFKSNMSGFAFDESRYINSLVDYDYKMLGKRTFQKSFVDPNNKLGIYHDVINNGQVVLQDDQIYQFKYEVADIYGNKSILAFKVKGNRKTSPESTTKSTVPVLDYSKTNHFSDKGVKVTIPANSFYRNEAFVFEKAGVGAYSAVWRVGQRTIPLHLPMEIAIEIPEKYNALKAKLCLARKDAAGKLYFAGGANVSGWVSATVNETGDYTLAIDSIKPAASIKNPLANNNYKGQSTLELTVTDNFSGIAGYRCLIDDRWALFEYDQKTNRLVCPLKRIPIAKGKNHTLKVEVTDGCGNTTIKNWKFFY